MPIRIILADDHTIFRQALTSMLSKESEFQVVGEADNGNVAIELAKELNPDVIIMDISMPDLNGIEATRRIINENPHTKVIALSMHEDRNFVTRMLKAGASGYLLKGSIYEDLVRAIWSVQNGKGFLSPRIANLVIESVAGQPDKSIDALDVLTSREKEILQLLAEGLSSKQVASRLNISAATVDKHRRNIMEKLDIHGIVELTRFAIRHGLTTV